MVSSRRANARVPQTACFFTLIERTPASSCIGFGMLATFFDQHVGFQTLLHSHPDKQFEQFALVTHKAYQGAE